MPGIYLPVGAGIQHVFGEDFGVARENTLVMAIEWIGGDET